MYNTLDMRNNNCNNNKNNSANIKCNTSVIEKNQTFSFLWSKSNGNLQLQRRQKPSNFTTTKTTLTCLSCLENKKTVEHLAIAGKVNRIPFTYAIGKGVNAFRSKKYNRTRHDPQRHNRHDNVHSFDNLISFKVFKNMQNEKSGKNQNEKSKLNKEIIKHNLNLAMWENSKANLHRQVKEDFYIGQSTSPATITTTATIPKHFSLLSPSPSPSPSPSTKSLFSSLFLMQISGASRLPILHHQPSAEFASLPNHINQPATLLQVPTSETAKANGAATTLMSSTATTPSHSSGRIFKRESKTTRSPFTQKPTKSSTSTELLDYIFITEVYDILPKRTTNPTTRRRTTKRTFWQIYGRILLIAFGVSASVACTTVGCIIAYRFCRTTNCRLAAIRFAIATSRPDNHQLQRRRRRRRNQYHNSRKENQNHTSALALPITLLPGPDQSLSPIEPEHSVSMLSVQTAGYAGMERLGVPTRTSLNTPPDEREQYRCRMRVDALQARELLAVRSETVIRNSNNSSIGSNKQHHHKQQHSHHKQQQQQQKQQRMTSLGNSSSSDGSECQPPNQQHGIINNNSINDSDSIMTRIAATPPKFDNTDSESFKGGDYSSTTGSICSSTSSANSHSIDHHLHYQQQLQQLTPRCPHHIPLPDSEYGQDRHLQIRTTYQQSEITRSYTKPPPNKTVRDVPTEQLQSCYRLSSASLHSAGNAGVTYPGQLPAHGSTHQQQTSKSKANPISKFFSRISSPKSPTTLALSVATNSAIVGGPISLSPSFGSSASISSSASSLASGVSSSNVSSSSSASSLAAAPLSTLPISNAASLKSTACSYGAQNISAQDYNTTSSSSTAINNHILAGQVPVPNTQTATTTATSFGTPASVAILERMPTPPLSVSVPIALHQHYQQHQQFEQPHSSNATGGLQIMKSSSCNLPPSHLLSGGCDKTDEGSASTKATPPISRNNSSSSMMSCTCNCNSKNCNHCADPTTTAT